MPINKLRIIFAGYSIGNTPRVKLLEEICFKNDIKPYVYGIVKKANHNINCSTYIRTHEDRTGIKKIFKVFSNILNVMQTIFREKESGVNYAINPVAGFICYFIYKIKGIEYIYDSQEMFFGVTHSGFNVFIKKLIGYVEKKIIESASLTLFSDEFRLKFTRRYYHLETPCLDYIYNASSVNLLGKENARKEMKLPINQTIISYCGGVTLARQVDVIVEGFYKADITGTLLYLVGTIDKDTKDKIEYLIDKLDLTGRIIIVGEVNNNVLKRYMEASDITLAFYKPDSLNNRFCSPNKIFDAIALKVFIITSPCPLTSKLINKYGVGLTLKKVTKKSIADALKAFNLSTNLELYDKANDKIGWQAQKNKLENYVKLLCINPNNLKKERKL